MFYQKKKIFNTNEIGFLRCSQTLKMTLGSRQNGKNHYLLKTRNVLHLTKSTKTCKTKLCITLSQIKHESEQTLEHSLHTE